ncbi:MAG TPA: aminotransferase class III-fold pyridoxal phosphate-dependent enzyme, partial [Acidimicrobiia bacterium]|nr:aminotransferase class III-fold pyridoxal phosphate-dependent enzyme [Acidimicrobiia bacterium]
ARLDYVHAATFTTPALEAYAERLAPHLPVSDPRVFPVSGGSEATETAIKLAVAYQAARGEPERIRLVARHASYHGNSLGALDLSGRPSLRAPYEELLGRFIHVPALAESDDPTWHARHLEAAIESGGVAAFIAEPIGGAASAGAVPPDGYWEAITEVCVRHGVLLIADEVMTGFGRTGEWFAADHFSLKPDILTAGKGASSGYWPLGLCVASGEVAAAVGEGRFVHGFTFSHHPIGAAVATAVLDLIEKEGLVERSAHSGQLLRARLMAAGFTGLSGRGLLVGVEVGDSGAVTAACRNHGLLVYPATADAILLGPPLVISDDEIDELVERLAAAAR